MKQPKNYGTNTTTPAGRAEGQFENDPGGGTGSGVVAEADNDNLYNAIAVIQSYKEGGITDSDETTTASDMRDAIEQLTHKRITDPVTPANSLAEWASGTNYTTIGEMVTHRGFQFVAYDVTGNLAKDPLISPDYWHIIPKPDEMLLRYQSGQIFSGGLSPMADRAGGNYRQNISFGRYRLGGNGGTFYDFFRVALDGTQVTGDATLVAIFDVGGGNEYFNIDLIAPDVVGTRTLIDMGERIVTPQSSGGENDTLGEELDDRFQGHWHENDVEAGASGTYGLLDDPNASSTGNLTLAHDAITDTVNGAPRTGLTTRPKEFTEGASYIIVMLPA